MQGTVARLNVLVMLVFLYPGLVKIPPDKYKCQETTLITMHLATLEFWTDVTNDLLRTITVVQIEIYNCDSFDAIVSISILGIGSPYSYIINQAKSLRPGAK